MSGYLLDTNILIALINKSQTRLPRRIGDLLKEPGAGLNVSVVSAWEVSIKTSAGKLQGDEDIKALGSLIPAYGCTLLPMTIDHALEVAHPEPATKDPFDRLLLAICACEGMKLVTTDAKLAGHRLIW
jgi:PIN domain nuclease of toxin-antitoxin system